MTTQLTKLLQLGMLQFELLRLKFQPFDFQKFVMFIMQMFVAMGICLNLSFCAYRQGAPERVVPGGYNLVRVPMFYNLTQEVGVETSFTNAMIDELIQSRVAKIGPSAEVDVKGTIESIQYTPSGPKTLSKFGDDSVVLAANYHMVIVMELALVKRNSEQVIWSAKFTGERDFPAAQIESPIVNSANPLYNLSARRRNIAELAQDLVAEATDKMTENF